MSQKTTAEKNLWVWLKGAKDQVPDRMTYNGYRWIYTPGIDHLLMIRVENSAKTGTPDVNGCLNGVDFWIELKSKKRTRTINTGLTVAQALFLHSRWQAGGRAYLLMEVGGDRRYLIRGIDAPGFVGVTTEAELGTQAVSMPLGSNAFDYIKAICSDKRTPLSR